MPITISFLTGEYGEHGGIVVNSKFCRDYSLLKRYHKNPVAAISIILNRAWEKAAQELRIWPEVAK